MALAPGLPGSLPVRRVERRAGRRFRRQFAHVANDAHDLQAAQVAVHVAELNEAAERIAAGPLRVSE